MKRNYLRSITAGLGLGLMIAGALALASIPVALAQGPNRTFAPRYLTDQQTTYTRFAVNAGSCSPGTGLSCSFRVGAVPYNTFLLRGYTQTYTTFANATTATTAFTASVGTGGPVTAGVVANPANLVAATSIMTAGNAAALTIVATGLGTGFISGTPNTGVLGNGSALPPGGGGNNSFDLWVTLTATGGYPTTGSAVIILEYILPNDGSCAGAYQTTSGTTGGPPPLQPGC